MDNSNGCFKVVVLCFAGLIILWFGAMIGHTPPTFVDGAIKAQYNWVEQHERGLFIFIIVSFSIIALFVVGVGIYGVYQLCLLAKSWKKQREMARLIPQDSYEELQTYLKDSGFLRTTDLAYRTFDTLGLIRLVGFQPAMRVVGSVVHHYDVCDPVGQSIMRSIGKDIPDMPIWQSCRFLRLASRRHRDVRTKLAPFVTTK